MQSVSIETTFSRFGFVLLQYLVLIINNLGEIPMFYDMLNSTDEQMRERSFMLQILQAGIGDQHDHALSSRRHLLEILTSFSDSRSLCSSNKLQF